jgi:putative transposase
MSGRANPYDNAWTESVIGTIKHEMIQDGCFEDIDDARVALFDYIDGYYNTRRKHSSIGYTTPNQYERNLTNLTKK